MNAFEVMSEAADRVGTRRLVRALRSLALQALLRGEAVPEGWIDTPQRLRQRAALLQLPLAGLQPDPVATRQLYEAVIGQDDTLPRRFLLQAEQAARAVGRMVVQVPGGGVLYGSAVLLSPRLMITNHHVLQYAEQARDAVLELGYYELAAGQLSGEYCALTLDPERFFYTSPGLDFTLVAVDDGADGADSARYGTLPLLAESGKALVGERVNIVHHAGGRPQSISIRANEVVDVFDQWLHYRADTAPGSSGAAVFNDAWQLVAIHHASVPSSDGQGMINEGIRVSAIVNDVLQAWAE